MTTVFRKTITVIAILALMEPQVSQGVSQVKVPSWQQLRFMFAYVGLIKQVSCCTCFCHFVCWLHFRIFTFL